MTDILCVQCGGSFNPDNSSYVCPHRSIFETKTEYKICHCELTGELHVVCNLPKQHCELCDVPNKKPLTPENVGEAFKWYSEQLNKTSEELKDIREEYADLKWKMEELEK